MGMKVLKNNICIKNFMFKYLIRKKWIKDFWIWRVIKRKYLSSIEERKGKRLWGRRDIEEVIVENF